MASSLVVKLFCLVAIVCLALGAPKAHGAVTCNQVVSGLSPCVSYLTSGRNSAPPAACCNGVTRLFSLAQTKQDRQQVCNCIKNAVGGMSIPPAMINRASSIPKQCGVNIPYQINPNVDCSRIQ